MVVIEVQRTGEVTLCVAGSNSIRERLEAAEVEGSILLRPVAVIGRRKAWQRILAIIEEKNGLVPSRSRNRPAADLRRKRPLLFTRLRVPARPERCGDEGFFGRFGYRQRKGVTMPVSSVDRSADSAFAIERQVRRHIAGASSILPHSRLPFSASTPHHLYDLLYGFIRRLIAYELTHDHLFLSDSISSDDITNIFVDTTAYNLSIAPSHCSIDELYISILSINHGSNTIVKASSSLGQCGPYRTLHLYIDQQLAGVTDMLETICVHALMSGFHYIDSKLFSVLTAQLTSHNADLYNCLRGLFAENIAQRIYLYIIDPCGDSGMILDQIGFERVRQLFMESPDPLPHSPIDIAAGLATIRFPFADTVASRLFPDMSTGIFHPLAIPSAHRLGASQYILFDKEPFCMQPLAKTSRLWLEAAYPARYRDTILPVLRTECPIVEDILHNYNRTTYLNSIKSVFRGEFLYHAGTFVGSTAASLMRGLSGN